MPNNPTPNNTYASLLNSIDDLSRVEKTIIRDKALMSTYVDYIHQNEAEICKFGKSTMELQTYLDEYDFTKGFQFNTMQGRLEKLHPLRLKLAKMGEEAKKLSVFPDRYDSKKAIDICRGLALTCMERMSLSESEKVSELVETNTQKLIALQKLFERDGIILSQINATIESNKMVLNKCKAYMSELEQYVSGFPHQGVDDLEFVKNRIASAKQVVDLWETVDKAIEAVKDYANRFNKNILMNNYSQVVIGLSSKMRYADVGNYMAQLNGVLQQKRTLCDAFEKECKELQSLQRSLMQKEPDVWREDNERLLSKVSAILKGDSKKVSFDLGQLENNLADAKAKRKNDIDKMVKQNTWLERKKKYRALHKMLLTQFITFDEYRSAVHGLKKIRVTRRILTFVPVVGWICMPEIK